MSDKFSVTKPNFYQLALNHNLGCITNILFSTPRNTFKIGALKAQVLPALKLWQVSILYNELSHPVAYAIWGYLTDIVIDDLVRTDRLLHDSELNEGDNLVILDFVAPFGHARDLHRQLRTLFEGRFSHVWGIKSRRGCRKVIDIVIRPTTLTEGHAIEDEGVSQ